MTAAIVFLMGVGWGCVLTLLGLLFWDEWEHRRP